MNQFSGRHIDPSHHSSAEPASDTDKGAKILRIIKAQQAGERAQWVAENYRDISDPWSKVTVGQYLRGERPRPCYKRGSYEQERIRQNFR